MSDSKSIFVGRAALASAVLLATGPVLAQQVDDLPVAAGGDTLFSLDIGSDTEISDPLGYTAGEYEYVDPGDVHRSDIAGGGSMYLNDAVLFPPGDPRPVEGLPGTRVPVGAAAPYSRFFDLDAYDSLSVSLVQIGINPQSPLEGPIRRSDPTVVAAGGLPCVHEASELLVSLEDDAPEGWHSTPSVPTDTTSVTGYTYGIIPDEIVQLSIDMSGLFPGAAPAIISAFAGVALEGDTHVSLAPDPVVEAEDDDVDALDVVADADDNACKVHLIGADNEGYRGYMRPLDVYETDLSGAFPAAAIGPVHLGFVGVGAPRPDIDAFEFAWVRDNPCAGDPASCSLLAFLFSVDADDPTTAGDESGGLDPSAIYGSFLNGSFFTFVPGQALEQRGLVDIDAIATAIPDSDGPDAASELP